MSALEMIDICVRKDPDFSAEFANQQAKKTQLLWYSAFMGGINNAIVTAIKQGKNGCQYTINRQDKFITDDQVKQLEEWLKKRNFKVKSVGPAGYGNETLRIEW